MLRRVAKDAQLPCGARLLLPNSVRERGGGGSCAGLAASSASELRRGQLSGILAMTSLGACHCHASCAAAGVQHTERGPR